MIQQRVGFIAYHACPLAAPGQGKSGGMNVYVRELARALGNLGMPVDIFTRMHPGTKSTIEQVTPMVRVVHLPDGDLEAPIETLFHHLPQFLEALEDFQRDNHLDYRLVHSHYWLSGWVGQAFAQEQNVPHVLTFHTLGLIKMQSRAGQVEPVERQQVERDLMASAQSVVAFSSHERDSMVRLYGADASRITLAPCGVDLSLFRPLDQDSVRDRLGLNGEKVFLYVGRLEPLKGLDLLLHMTSLLETSENLRVLVVGGGTGDEQEVARLRRLARTLEVEEVFEFVGRVEQEELPLYYNAADVCVVPSYYESFRSGGFGVNGLRHSGGGSKGGRSFHHHSTRTHRLFKVLEMPRSLCQLPGNDYFQPTASAEHGPSGAQKGRGDGLGESGRQDIPDLRCIDPRKAPRRY